MLCNAIKYREVTFMIRKDKKKMKDGSHKTYIRVVESYRPGPGMKPKQRTIKSFGYLEDHSDPIAFMKEIERFDANRENFEQPATLKMYSGKNRTMNYGYKFLESIYLKLGVPEFIHSYMDESGFKGTYPLEETFRYLVLQRILYPDSKRASVARQNAFYGWELELELQNVYRSLDHVAAFSTNLQHFLDERVKDVVGRDLSYAFYDVTNYFFDIDFPDDPGLLRRKGVSKEHRTDPIVQMGMFIDSNGLPVSMSLFPGNTSDTTTLQPVVTNIKEAYRLRRLIVVADKGLNSSKNIDFICQNGDGYVVSQILRGKKGTRYHEKLFDEADYIWNGDRTHKYKLFKETYKGTDKNGKKETRERQVLIYWNKAEADRMRRKREDKLKLAQRASGNNVYGIKKGVSEYTQDVTLDKETGEMLQNTKKVRLVDYEKAERDALFDGYFCLITSEMNYDAAKIREVYSGLWKIEESFRILKSDLKARPVFVSTQEHIQAHFLICFVALLIVRMIQHAMGDKALSTERIARALQAATLKVNPAGGYVNLDDVGGSLGFKQRVNKKGELVDTLEFSDLDEVAQDYQLIQKTFGTDFYEVQAKQEVFNRFLKKIDYKL